MAASAVIAALAAASSIERALIGSNLSTSVLEHVSMRVPQRNCLLLGFTGQIRRNSYVGKERLTIGKRVAVAGQHALDHRLLREMQENALAQGPCADPCGVHVVERALDGI